MSEAAYPSDRELDALLRRAMEADHAQSTRATKAEWRRVWEEIKRRKRLRGDPRYG